MHCPFDQVRGSNKVVDQDPEGKYEALSKYARDLTAAAREGKLDPVIGRDDEIRRCIQILSRRTKNNPVLIGEPGAWWGRAVAGTAGHSAPARHKHLDGARNTHACICSPTLGMVTCL